MANNPNTKFNNKQNAGNQTKTSGTKQKSEKDKNLNMQDQQ
ncbi:hypothetical protein [Brevibacillus sp. SYSU BS000544]